MPKLDEVRGILAVEEGQGQCDACPVTGSGMCITNQVVEGFLCHDCWSEVSQLLVELPAAEVQLAYINWVRRSGEAAHTS